jgi:hypothetical protein
VFLVNSRLGRFTAAPSGSRSKSDHPTGAPLLPKLRGHFAEFLNEGSSDRLGILYLSTCVGFGTGTPHLPRRFSRRHGFRDFPHFWGGLPVSGLNGRRICLSPALRGYPRSTNAWDPLSYPVPPSVIAVGTWYWNINQLAIAYACRPRLRSRLTLSRLALLRNPWTFGGGVSHPSFVTHASILTSHASTAGFRRRFAGMGTLPYHSSKLESVASAPGLSPVELSALDHLTSELLRTL